MERFGVGGKKVNGLGARIWGVNRMGRRVRRLRVCRQGGWEVRGVPVVVRVAVRFVVGVVVRVFVAFRYRGKGLRNVILQSSPSDK